MTKDRVESGGFTLPGEAGYEALTLRLAEKWGADVIRDSDGTELSSEILEARYDIYSTICIIRDHNAWAEKNRNRLQQTFLMTQPETAWSNEISFFLLKDFSEEQFEINDSVESLEYWEVFDRTTGKKIDRACWHYEKEEQCVKIKGILPWHKYTVSFVAYRIWEEISMYNHKTNHWDKEHLLQIDPRYKEVRDYMKDWLRQWCERHPHTNVVRFTSLFYNFVWIWGSSQRKLNWFTDWASYDFTVSPKALKEFEACYGYALSAEDFINQGKLHVTHMPGNQRKRDWMEFINTFVVSFGKELIEIVHKYGKKAYVFYDDSWVGIEPYGIHFKDFGFDGIIKCVFHGYEARLCSGVDVKIHELRLHPYLFPTGVDGSPSFLEGGNPKKDAQKYWQSVRRGILRAPVERIGLGGYLHLVEKAPEFEEYITCIAKEFRKIRKLHESGRPAVLKPKIGVLHYWGSLRSWTLSGHFHETYKHDLIHINESLAGLPFDVTFLSFEDIKNGTLKELDVVINAGYGGSAWSGGEVWNKTEIIEKLTQWVYEGGVFIGVNEPSAAPGADTYFRMAHILGVDEDRGERVCHGKWKFEARRIKGLIPSNAYVKKKENIYLTDGKAQVLLEEDGIPTLTLYKAGKGTGIYMGGYELSLENIRMLQNLILYGTGESLEQEGITENLYTECTVFPNVDTAIIINNTEKRQSTTIWLKGKRREVELEAFESCFIQL